jgi:hypothetical protein
MAWFQVGTKKINTAVVAYIEQVDSTVKIHFNGGGSLELVANEAAGFWRNLKAENALVAIDKGSTTTLPKYVSTPAYPSPAKDKPASDHKPAVAAPAHASSSHSSSHSSGSIGLKKH